MATQAMRTFGAIAAVGMLSATGTTGMRPTPACPPKAAIAYVVNEWANTVTPINTATSKALKPISAGNSPTVITVTPDGKMAYVENSGSGTVTPIRTATNTALKPIKVSGVGVITAAPDSKTVYVSTSDSVVPISTRTNTTLTPIKVATSQDIPMAITPNGKTLYAISGGAGVVPITTGIYTWAAAITPNGKVIYVTNYSSPGLVVPIDTRTNAALKPIAVGSSPDAIAIASSSVDRYPR